MIEVDQVRFMRMDQGRPVPRGPSQVWDMVTPEGRAFARAEVFEGPNQWGVRLFDQAAELEDTDLVDLCKRLLVWEAGCRTDTVEVVLVRNAQRHMLVKVGGDYV